MFSKTSGQLLREHTRNPRHLNLIRTQGTDRCSCDKIAAFARCEQTWISLRAQRDMFRRKDCCVVTPGAHLDLFQCANRHVHATTAAFARCEQTWISLRAQRYMFRRKDCCVVTPGARLDLFQCANRQVHATTLLRSHAVSTLGYHSVRKKACSGKKSVAFSRRERAWISLRAQKDMFHRKDCCVLTPRARLDLSPCAKRHVPSKRLLRFRAAPRDR